MHPVQTLTGFWSEIRNGIRRTNIEQVLTDLPLIRERTLKLWDTVTQKYIGREPSQNVIDAMLHRLHYLKYGERSNGSNLKPAARGRVTRVDVPSEKPPRLFTEMRESHRVKALEFVGGGKESILKFVLRHVAMLTERLYQYLRGHPYRSLSEKVNNHPGKVNKISHIFLNTFFKDVGFESISFTLQPTSVFAFLRLTAEKRKAVIFQVVIFKFDLLYFATIIRRQKQLLRGGSLEKEKVRILVSHFKVDNELLLSCICRQNIQMIQSHGGDSTQTLTGLGSIFILKMNLFPRLVSMHWIPVWICWCRATR